MFGVEVSLRRDCQVKMSHLGMRTVRLGHLGQDLDLLESQLTSPYRVLQHQPVLPFVIRLPPSRALVAFAVTKPEELTVELGQTARIRAVEDHLPQRNSHLCHVSNAALH